MNYVIDAIAKSLNEWRIIDWEILHVHVYSFNCI